MKRVPVAIAPIQLTTSNQIVYTVPAGTTTTIGNLSITNTSAAVVSVNLYNVPSGGTPSAANQFAPTFSLSPGQPWVPPPAIGLSMGAGATLQASASAGASLTLMGGVYETSGS